MNLDNRLLQFCIFPFLNLESLLSVLKVNKKCNSKVQGLWLKGNSRQKLLAHAQVLIDTPSVLKLETLHSRWPFTCAELADPVANLWPFSDLQYSDSKKKSSFAMLRFLHRSVNLTRKDLRNGQAASAIINTATWGHLTLLRFLHKNIHLTTEDAKGYYNLALRLAATSGHVHILQYLYWEMNQTREDARTMNNYALRVAAANGHLSVVQCLHWTFELTTEDARDDENSALRQAATNGHLGILRYLHQEMKLTAADARAMNNYALRYAGANGYLSVVQYLHQEFKLIPDDADMSPKSYKKRKNFLQ